MNKQNKLKPSHLHKEENPRKTDFYTGLSKDGGFIYDETAYQKALSEYKEKYPHNPELDSHWCDKETHDKKVKAWEESQVFYEGFKKLKEGNQEYYSNGVIRVEFDPWITVDNGKGITLDADNGITLEQFEAITNLKPKEL